MFRGGDRPGGAPEHDHSKSLGWLMYSPYSVPYETLRANDTLSRQQMISHVSVGITLGLPRYNAVTYDGEEFVDRHHKNVFNWINWSGQDMIL